MKTKIKIIALLLALSFSAALTTQKVSAQVSVSFQVFYDDLNPYGNWVDYTNYGYCWVPNVPAGFTPYGTNGYWVFTDDGWTWISYYSWGWAPFHYGRWFYDAYYGWLWVPDDEWGPGWVSWRFSNDYCGWAPIAPGISIDIAYSNSYNLPYNQWTFVRTRDFGRTNINNYYVNRTSNVTIINNTTVVNNTRIDRARNVRYNAGPDRTEVERRAGRRFTPVAIRESNKPGQHLANNQLRIYRPRVEKNNAGGRKPAPPRVVPLENVRKNSARRNTEIPSPGKNQPTRQERNDQQNKQQQQRIGQQKQQRQRNDQQNKLQQQQRVDQQRKQQQQEQQQHQRIDQQRQQQEQQQRQRVDQQKQQQEQQQRQRMDQQKQQQQQRQQEQQRQRNDQQNRQQQHTNPPGNQQPPSQPQKPPKKGKGNG